MRLESAGFIIRRNGTSAQQSLRLLFKRWPRPSGRTSTLTIREEEVAIVRVRFRSAVFTRSRLLDRFIILTYGECCVCGLANTPNELDMIDSVAILRSRWEIVRQMRESIKVMTVRIRVVIRRSKIIRFMSRPAPSRNFHRNEKRRTALINVLGAAFWAYIDEFAIVIHWCKRAVPANEMKCDRLSLVKRSGKIKSRIAIAVTSILINDGVSNHNGTDNGDNMLACILVRRYISYYVIPPCCGVPGYSYKCILFTSCGNVSEKSVANIRNCGKYLYTFAPKRGEHIVKM